MLIASIPFGAFAQKKNKELSWPAMELDAKTNLITYTGVVEVKGADANELYDRTMKWGNDHYKNFAEKLRKQDKAAGEMEIFGRFPFYAYDKKGTKTTSRQGLAQYTLTILFKEGRYKYTITALNYKASSYQALEQWLDREDPNARNHSFYLTDIDTEIRNTIKSMQDAVATSGGGGEDDW